MCQSQALTSATRVYTLHAHPAANQSGPPTCQQVVLRLHLLKRLQPAGLVALLQRRQAACKQAQGVRHSSQRVWRTCSPAHQLLVRALVKFSA